MERVPSRLDQTLEDVGTYFGPKDGCTPLTSGLRVARAGAGMESRKGVEAMLDIKVVVLIEREKLGGVVDE